VQARIHAVRMRDFIFGSLGLRARFLVALAPYGTCYFAPNICSSLPSWLDRQRATPFLKERDTTASLASSLPDSRERHHVVRGRDLGLCPCRQPLPVGGLGVALDLTQRRVPGDGANLVRGAVPRLAHIAEERLADRMQKQDASLP
jgi:hypothetical protein